MAHRINARIVLHFEGRAAGFVELLKFLFAGFRIDVHTAEFVHRKELAVFADADLLKDNGSLRVAELDDQGAGDENRGKQNDAAEGRYHVEGPLDEFLGVNGKFVRLGENVTVEQALEREKPVVAHIELFNRFVEFLIPLFLKTGVNADLENRLLGLFTQNVDETRLFNIDEHFATQAFQNA